jgi:hypothetical protein
VRRAGIEVDAQRIEAAVDRWGRFNDVLVDADSSVTDVDVIDATRSVGEVEGDVRAWVLERLGCS